MVVIEVFVFEDVEHVKAIFLSSFLTDGYLAIFQVYIFIL